MRFLHTTFVTTVIVAVGLALSWVVQAETTLPHAFVAGDLIRADQVNANFDALAAAIDAVAATVPAGLPAEAQARVAESCPAGSAIRAIAADGTVTCEEDDIGSGGGGGDVTAVTAGTGLTGGGVSGDLTLELDTSFGDARWATRADLASAGDAAVAFGNLTGVPAGLADGDDDTTYSATGGLTLSGTTFSIATAGVTSARIANDAVTSAKIADDAIASPSQVDVGALRLEHLRTTDVNPGGTINPSSLDPGECQGITADFSGSSSGPDLPRGSLVVMIPSEDMPAGLVLIPTVIIREGAFTRVFCNYGNAAINADGVNNQTYILPPQ